LVGPDTGLSLWLYPLLVHCRRHPDFFFYPETGFRIPAGLPGPKNHCLGIQIMFNQGPVNLIAKLQAAFAGKPGPEHLRRGKLGEQAAKKYLERQGMKFLAANFRSEHGEIDLIFRDGDCLALTEVKTRSSEAWTRPAAAVDARKRRRLSRTALDYLRRLKNPEVKFRFDIVEVLLADGAVREVRHLPNVFSLSRPYRYA